MLSDGESLSHDIKEYSISGGILYFGISDQVRDSVVIKSVLGKKYIVVV